MAKFAENTEGIELGEVVVYFGGARDVVFRGGSDLVFQRLARSEQDRQKQRLLLGDTGSDRKRDSV